MAPRRTSILGSLPVIVLLASVSLIAGVALTLSLRHSLTSAVGRLHEAGSDDANWDEEGNEVLRKPQRSITEDKTEGAPVAESTSDAAECAVVPDFPKVALMFLTRGMLHHEPTWTRWFKEAEGLVPLSAIHKAACNTRWSFKKGKDISGVDCWYMPQQSEDLLVEQETGHQQRLLRRQFLFSVYIHSRPDFPGFPKSSIFYGREIKDRIVAEWGSITLIDALRKLLNAALRDKLNQKMLLLSESGVPLFAPQLIYSQILFESGSRLDSCGIWGTSGWRWTGEMEIPGVLYEGDFRKSSQWVGLRRDHAKLVARDKKVYEKFKEHCFLDTRWWWRDCYSDEHYVATLIAASQLGHETDCHGNLVSVQWDEGGAHPRSYNPDEINDDLIRWLRHSGCGDYNSLLRLARSTLYDVREGTNHWEDDFCTAQGTVPVYNSSMEPVCSLFARKFGVDTSLPVLSVVGGCGSTLNITSPSSCAQQGALEEEAAAEASVHRQLLEAGDDWL